MAQPAPMVPGGVWLQTPDAQGPATYVAHSAHITRLTLDGWLPVPDPRVVHTQATQTPTHHHQTHEETLLHLQREQQLLDEIAELKALLMKVSEAKPEPKVDDGKQPRRKSE